MTTRDQAQPPMDALPSSHEKPWLVCCAVWLWSDLELCEFVVDVSECLFVVLRRVDPCPTEAEEARLVGRTHATVGQLLTSRLHL